MNFSFLNEEASPKMAWKVKRIQEGDYGCEERAEEERNQVIVTLVDEDGAASGRRSPPPSCRSKPQKNQCKGKY